MQYKIKIYISNKKKEGLLNIRKSLINIKRKQKFKKNKKSLNKNYLLKSERTFYYYLYYYSFRKI